MAPNSEPSTNMWIF